MRAEGDNLIELAPGLRIPEDALRMQASRSSGPGGQNVNKVSTRIEVWLPLSALWMMDAHAMARLRTIAGRRITREDELHVIAQSERSQERNRDAAIARLAELVSRAMTAPKPRRPTRPTAGSKRRRIESKKRKSQTKSGRKEPRDW